MKKYSDLNLNNFCFARTVVLTAVLLKNVVFRMIIYNGRKEKILQIVVPKSTIGLNTVEIYLYRHMSCNCIRN